MDELACHPRYFSGIYKKADKHIRDKTMREYKFMVLLLLVPVLVLVPVPLSFSSASSSLTRPLTHSLSQSLTHPFSHSLAHSLAPSLAHTLFHPLTHSAIHSISHSLTHSVTHSPTHTLNHSLINDPIVHIGPVLNEKPPYITSQGSRLRRNIRRWALFKCPSTALVSEEPQRPLGAAGGACLRVVAWVLLPARALKIDQRVG